MSKTTLITSVCLLLFAGACSKTADESATAEGDAAAGVPDDRPVEGRSFAGDPLYRNPIAPDRLAELSAQAVLLEAKDSLTEDEYIELGRSYIAANRFRDTIELYTRGLQEHPESFRLLRHRGHRYINVRELDNAIADLNRAVELIGDAHTDVLEYNSNGEPSATYEHWVYYHIGLYHYLNENWAEAAAAFQKCVDTATANPVLVGATDWLYNAYQKGGMPEAAQAAIDAIPADLETNREHPYFKRVMVYKGEWEPGRFVNLDKPGEDWSGGDITVGYGIANWYRFNGDSDMAEEIHRKILRSPSWNAWAWVVTDKEYENR